MNLLVKKSQTSPMKSIFSDFFEVPAERFFDTNLWPSNGWLNRVPAVNIRENGNNYSVELAVPGMEKKDFKVTIENGCLNISAEKEESKKEKDENFTREEYNYSSFNRSFYLPDSVSSDKIDAHYENGVLKVILPKKAEAKKNGTKQIKVS